MPAPATHHRFGRRANDPYTTIGIERLPCIRCGNPAFHSWQACADGRLHRPLCIPCDVELNDKVLEWTGDPDRVKKMERYKKGHRHLFAAQLDRLRRAGRAICPKWARSLDS